MFVAAVTDGPGFGDVVGDGSSSGPDVAVTGHVAAIIEIVEDAELTGEFVLVGSDILAVHGQRAIAVASAEIAEDLIVSTILFNNVNHVMDFVFTAGKSYPVRIAAYSVGFGDLFCVSLELCRQVGKRDARQ